MSGLREAVAHAISVGNMTQDAETETGADMIGALARADKLGAALWRVTGNMDPGAFIAAREYLMERITTDIPLTFFERESVAQIVMQEWLACQCSACGGRKFILTDSGARATCGACGGTGRGTFTPNQRMAALGCRAVTYARLSHVFDAAHKALTAADARVERQIAYQLERRKTLKTKASSKRSVAAP